MNTQNSDSFLNSLPVFVSALWTHRAGRQRVQAPVLLRLALGLLFLGATNSALAQTNATVTTDKEDYAPGSTVQITGSGFQNNETVQLQVLRTDIPENSGEEHDPWTVTNDASGNFQTTWYVTYDELGATLELTATGLTSGLTAQTTFTDGASYALSAHQVGAANVCAGSTTVLIHSFMLDGQGSPGSVTGLKFKTTGNYGASEIVRFQLYRTTTSTFSTVNLVSTIDSPAVAGTQTFPAFNVAQGNSTYYYWITMDVASSLTAGHTLAVSATAAADITAGGVSGSAGASGTQTLTGSPSGPGAITQANPTGSSVCSGAIGVTYSISSVSGATTYTWAVPSGATITAGQGTTSITVNWGAAASGSVSVTAGNTCGTSPASTLAVTLNAAPAITGAPAGATKTVGQSVTFSVTAIGPGLTYQWRKNTGNLSGATSSSYTISSVLTGDAGSYDCVVAGTCGSPATSQAAVLTVNKANANVTTWPTASAITYGQTLASSTLSVGSATPSGSFAFTTSSTAPNAGTASQGVTYTPTDTANYNTASGTVNVTVGTKALTITASAQSKTYGNTLSLGTTAFSVGSGLVGSESVTAVTLTANGGTEATDSAGSYTITPSAATGSNGFLVSNYNITYATGTLTVNAATTTSVVTTSLNPALPTENVTFTATISAIGAGSAIPTGTVQFTSNGTNNGTPVALSSGQASLTVPASSLGHGSKSISAVYGNADGNFVAGSTGTLSPNQVVNTPPVGHTHALGTTLNKAIVISALNLGKVDTDADGDTLVVTAVNSPSHGTTSLSGGTVTYTPGSSYVGADSFTYTVSDTFGGTTTSTANLTVRLGSFTSTISNQATQPDGNFTLIATGIAGTNYVIQATSDVANGSWTSLGTVTALPNGLISFTDLNATNFSQRYYRLALP